jgi:hypothetical protein
MASYVHTELYGDLHPVPQPTTGRVGSQSIPSCSTHQGAGTTAADTPTAFGLVHDGWLSG